MTLQGQLTDTPMSIIREAPNRDQQVKKKIMRRSASYDLLVGAVASSLLVAIFDRKKIDIKTLNSVTVHL